MMTISLCELDGLSTRGKVKKRKKIGRFEINPLKRGRYYSLPSSRVTPQYNEDDNRLKEIYNSTIKSKIAVYSSMCSPKEKWKDSSEIYNLKVKFENSEQFDPIENSEDRSLLNAKEEKRRVNEISKQGTGEHSKVKRALRFIYSTNDGFNETSVKTAFGGEENDDEAKVKKDLQEKEITPKEVKKDLQEKEITAKGDSPVSIYTKQEEISTEAVLKMKEHIQNWNWFEQRQNLKNCLPSNELCTTHILDMVKCIEFKEYPIFTDDSFNPEDNIQGQEDDKPMLEVVEGQSGAEAESPLERECKEDGETISPALRMENQADVTPSSDDTTTEDENVSTCPSDDYTVSMNISLENPLAVDNYTILASMTSENACTNAASNFNLWYNTFATLSMTPLDLHPHVTFPPALKDLTVVDSPCPKTTMTVTRMRKYFGPSKNGRRNPKRRASRHCYPKHHPIRVSRNPQSMTSPFNRLIRRLYFIKRRKKAAKNKNKPVDVRCGKYRCRSHSEKNSGKSGGQSPQGNGYRKTSSGGNSNSKNNPSSDRYSDGDCNNKDRAEDRNSENNTSPNGRYGRLQGNAASAASSKNVVKKTLPSGVPFDPGEPKLFNLDPNKVPDGRFSNDTVLDPDKPFGHGKQSDTLLQTIGMLSYINIPEAQCITEDLFEIDHCLVSYLNNLDTNRENENDNCLICNVVIFLLRHFGRHISVNLGDCQPCNQLFGLFRFHFRGCCMNGEMSQRCSHNLSICKRIHLQMAPTTGNHVGLSTGNHVGLSTGNQDTMESTLWDILKQTFCSVFDQVTTIVTPEKAQGASVKTSSPKSHQPLSRKVSAKTTLRKIPEDQSAEESPAGAAAASEPQESSETQVLLMKMPLEPTGLKPWQTRTQATDKNTVYMNDNVCTSVPIRYPLYQGSMNQLNSLEDRATGVPGIGEVINGMNTHLSTVARYWTTVKEKYLKGGVMNNLIREEGVILKQHMDKLWIGYTRYQENVQWMKLSPLGRGVSGRCYLATDINSECQFCVKEIHISNYHEDELLIGCKLNHQNIVKIYGAIRSGTFIFIMAEFIDGGSLAEHIQNQRELSRRLSKAVALRYFQQILEVLVYLQKNHVLHEDLKADNILLKTWEKGANIVVADFGLARQLQPGSAASVSPGTKPIGAQTQWSPEKAASRGYDFRSDVWAATCVLVHIFNGQPPWMQYEVNVLHYIIDDKAPPMDDMPQNVTSHIRDLILKGWTKDASARPFALELLQYVQSDLHAYDDRYYSTLGGSEIDNTGIPTVVENINEKETENEVQERARTPSEQSEVYTSPSEFTSTEEPGCCKTQSYHSSSDPQLHIEQFISDREQFDTRPPIPNLPLFKEQLAQPAIVEIPLQQVLHQPLAPNVPKQQASNQPLAQNVQQKGFLHPPLAQDSLQQRPLQQSLAHDEQHQYQHQDENNPHHLEGESKNRDSPAGDANPEYHGKPRSASTPNINYNSMDAFFGYGCPDRGIGEHKVDTTNHVDDVAASSQKKVLKVNTAPGPLRPSYMTVQSNPNGPKASLEYGGARPKTKPSTSQAALGRDRSHDYFPLSRPTSTSPASASTRSSRTNSPGSSSQSESKATPSSSHSTYDLQECVLQSLATDVTGHVVYEDPTETSYKAEDEDMSYVNDYIKSLLTPEDNDGSLICFCLPNGEKITSTRIKDPNKEWQEVIEDIASPKIHSSTGFDRFCVFDQTGGVIDMGAAVGTINHHVYVKRFSPDEQPRTWFIEDHKFYWN